MSMMEPHVIPDLDAAFDDSQGLSVGDIAIIGGKTYEWARLASGGACTANDALYDNFSSRVVTTEDVNAFKGIAQATGTSNQYLWVQTRGAFSGVKHEGSLVAGTCIIAGAASGCLAGYATAGVTVDERVLGYWTATAATAGATSAGVLT